MQFLDVHAAYEKVEYLSLQIRPVPLMKDRLLHNARLAEWAFTSLVFGLCEVQ